jgi:hypothetical protein
LLHMYCLTVHLLCAHSIHASIAKPLPHSPPSESVPSRGSCHPFPTHHDGSEVTRSILCLSLPLALQIKYWGISF